PVLDVLRQLRVVIRVREPALLHPEDVHGGRHRDLALDRLDSRGQLAGDDGDRALLGPPLRRAPSQALLRVDAAPAGERLLPHGAGPHPARALLLAHAPGIHGCRLHLRLHHGGTLPPVRATAPRRYPVGHDPGAGAGARRGRLRGCAHRLPRLVRGGGLHAVGVRGDGRVGHALPPIGASRARAAAHGIRPRGDHGVPARAVGLHPDLLPDRHAPPGSAPPWRQPAHDARGRRPPALRHRRGRRARLLHRPAPRRDRGRSAHHRLVPRRLVGGARRSRARLWRVELRRHPLSAGALYLARVSSLGGGHRPARLGHRHRHRQRVEDRCGVPGPGARHDLARLDASWRGLPGTGRPRPDRGAAPRGADRRRRQGASRMRPSQTVIRLSEVRMEKVGKRYGDTWAVRNVSLSIRPGEYYTLLGPSGCGKTTLLRMLAGFATPDEGRIFVDDELIDPVPPWKRNLGMVFQQYALWPHMSVFENVAFGLRERRVSGAALTTRVKAALAQVGLDGFERRRPSQLSGGQQQRVALARTLIVEPRLLLLDEPLSNLDAQLRSQMRLELARLHRDVGITTLYVTHDQAEALSLSTRIAVLSNGVLVQEGRPEEIYWKPRSAFVAEFVGAANLVPVRVV